MPPANNDVRIEMPSPSQNIDVEAERMKKRKLRNVFLMKVIGGLLLIAAIAGAAIGLYLFMKKKDQKKKDETTGSKSSSPTASPLPDALADQPPLPPPLAAAAAQPPLAAVAAQPPKPLFSPPSVDPPSKTQALQRGASLTYTQLDEQQVSEPLKKGLMAFHEFDVKSYDQAGGHKMHITRSNDKKDEKDIIEYFDMSSEDLRLSTTSDSMDARLLEDGIIAVLIEEQKWIELIDLKEIIWMKLPDRQDSQSGELYIGLRDKETQKTNKIWKLKFEKGKLYDWGIAMGKFASGRNLLVDFHRLG